MLGNRESLGLASRESLGVTASGKSFVGKYGGGFSMSERINAARKVAGLENASISHQPGYCEENVWHLIESLMDFQQARDISELHVVYVSNAQRKTQLWSMKEAKTEDQSSGRLVKPFHVFMVQTPKDHTQDTSGDSCPSYVWDLDATLPLPCRLTYYATNALQTSTSHNPMRIPRVYRIVSASQYLKHFASDRSHMKRVADNTWVQEPPTWEPIRNELYERSTIAKYMDMTPCPDPKAQLPTLETLPYGVVVNEKTFLEYFHAVPHPR